LQKPINRWVLSSHAPAHDVQTTKPVIKNLTMIVGAETEIVEMPLTVVLTSVLGQHPPVLSLHYSRLVPVPTLPPPHYSLRTLRPLHRLD
jgi:hypothetical protein